MKKNILVIPSHFIGPDKIRIRLIEIAKNLSPCFEVHLLVWNASIENSLFKRTYTCFADLFKQNKIYKKYSLNIVEFPLLHRPLLLAPKFNTYFLEKFIKKNNIEIVLNGSTYMFDFPKKKEFKYVLDLADLPAENDQSSFNRFIYKSFFREAIKADFLTTASYGLKEFIKNKSGRDAYLLPNGAYVDKLRSFNSVEAGDLRSALSLQNKWIIGYIGYIGCWVEVEFLVKVFQLVKKEIPNAVLLFVGPSDNLRNLRKKFASPEIIFIGSIPSDDIAGYFNCIDIGVVPKRKNYYQDVACHIKLIEYSAARKMVVATDLQEIKRLSFSNVITAALDIELWAGLIKEAKLMHWESSWDEEVKAYDWENIIKKLCGYLA